VDTKKTNKWFWVHVAVIFAGVFLIPGDLGWALAGFGAACAFLIRKFPKNPEPFVLTSEQRELLKYKDNDEFLGVCDITSVDLTNMTNR